MQWLPVPWIWNLYFPAAQGLDALYIITTALRGSFSILAWVTCLALAVHVSKTGDDVGRCFTLWTGLSEACVLFFIVQMALALLVTSVLTTYYLTDESVALADRSLARFRGDGFYITLTLSSIKRYTFCRLSETFLCVVLRESCLWVFWHLYKVSWHSFLGYLIALILGITLECWNQGLYTQCLRSR